jgi:hypothetical protein
VIAIAAISTCGLLMFAVFVILGIRRLRARKGGNRKGVFIKLERSDPEDRQGLLGHDDFSIHDDDEETILERNHTVNGSGSAHDGIAFDTSRQPRLVSHVWSFFADRSPLLAGGNDRGNDRRVYMDIPPTRDTPERSPGGSINHAITNRCAPPAV